jgi:hypothetical protein
MVALTVLALTGAALVLPEPTFARGGGMRGMPGGGFRAPLIMQRSPRAILPASPRAIARPAFTPRLGHAFRPHGFGSVRHAIPPSPHGYATTTPLRPFGRLARRHHGIYHQGLVLPDHDRRRYRVHRRAVRSGRNDPGLRPGADL